VKGAWRIKFRANKPLLESGVRCWRAEDAPSLDLRIAYTGQATTARILWKRLDADKYDSKKGFGVDLKPDGKFHTISRQPCIIRGLPWSHHRAGYRTGRSTTAGGRDGH